MAKIFSDEQSELRSTVRAFCANHFSEEAVRRDIKSESGFESNAWNRMATELGLQGIALPEQYGGAGGGQVELSIVIEELGRNLAPVPFLPAVAMAANLVLATDDEPARERLLPGIADGSRIATVAHRETTPGMSTAEITTAATREGLTWRLSGEKAHVVAANQSSTLLVTALTAEGLSLFEIDSDAPGVTTTPMQTLDLTRRQAIVEFDSAPAILIGQEGGAAEYVDKMDRLLSAAVCAENVGGALRLLEETTGYAQTREQFGRPIGSFQAVKQKAAGMLLNVELSRSAAYQVALEIDNADDAAGLDAAIAHALTSDAYIATAYDAIQIHGGIGFTWEHMAHLYFRRAKSNAALFGTPDERREQAAQLMGI
ncbi:acyl-CoA dehydrogenase family protein [Gordonia sp. CPCC 206044]|uniref:acyl-CoA dehydrogenase family protein n=1 Tax=Gordonia sp. CPCC 206044 TaxID=3140793 RepID=UPI003AF39A58